MYFQLKRHGGQCCGIKHLHNFPELPETKLSAVEARNLTGAVGENLMYIECPGETAENRLQRAIKHWRTKYASGVLEAVLMGLEPRFADEMQASWDNQYARWKDILEKEGFVLVNKYHNPNSGRRNYVYHLKYSTEV